MKARTGSEPVRIVVLGETCVSKHGIAAIVGRNKRYRVCARAHACHDATELLRQYRPDILLIEPFFQGRDGIRWIKDLVAQFPHTRILIVSRQSERTYAERALRAGAAGYWMKTGTERELLHAVEKIATGEIHISKAIASLAVHRLASRGGLPHKLDVLTDRELVVFSRIAAGRGISQIANELGISGKTVETHCAHIKLKLGYRDCRMLKRGARESFGTICA